MFGLGLSTLVGSGPLGTLDGAGPLGTLDGADPVGALDGAKLGGRTWQESLRVYWWNQGQSGTQ